MPKAQDFLPGNGETAVVDMMLVSAGVRPRIDIAAGTDIAVQRGIVVGNRMETNVPGVWACGDSAEHNGKFYGILPAAKEQGEICGTNIAGGNREYTGSVMSTRLSVLGVGLASLGDISLVDGTKTAVWRDAGTYKKLFLRNGLVAGAILLGDMKDFRMLDELIRKKENISSVTDLLAGAELM
jgi:nitrite reductase (NADH) large subunit